MNDGTTHGLQTPQRGRIPLRRRKPHHHRPGNSILMERYRWSAEQAFERLAVISQHTNRKLVMVASRLTDTGEWPHD